MGTGSSKSGSQPIAVNTARDATESEHRTHDRKEAPNLIESQVQVAKSNMEKEHDKPSQVPDTTAENNNEPSKGEGNVNQPATDTVVVNGPTQITMEETVNHLREVDSEAAGLLVSFCEQYPDVKVSLSKTMVYSRGLKEALDSGNMISPKTVELAKGLFDVYLKCKKPRNKAGVTDFAVRLEIPKLFCDTITHLRTKYPELTKWDRIKDLEKKETEETADNDQDERQDTVEDERANELIIAQDVVNNLGAAALNFSDLHDKFCLECSEAGMVPLFVEIIKELEDSVAHNARFVNTETQRLTKYTTRGKMLSRLMGALHNLSKRVPVRSSFIACGAVEVLIPFLKAEVTLYATKALLILAYLIDEENNHLIMADEGPIKFLTKTLDRSLRMTHHRFLGFSSAELAEGLTQIALNDSNKKTIAHCGAIPILSKMLRTAKEDEEKINGCNTLWTLAFDAENRQEIKNDQSAVTELRKLASDENSEIRKAAGGALWEIEGKEKHSEKTPPTTAGTGAEDIADTKHIMISYQWDVQSSMVQLKNKLQAEGFKVWMDVDEMGGSTLESMAKAVENASVVLIGVSQKYKESPNCRSEAEYTFQLHRDIIPLMMEKKYKPDGWLGMVVGTKFWIDFSDRYKLDSNVDKLKKELGNRGSLKVQEHVQVTTVDVVDAAPRPSINSWKTSEAKQWLVDSGLQKRMNQKAVERLDGPMLIRLQDLRKESPEFFYSALRQDFGLVNVFDVLEFTDALDKLVG